MKLSIIIVNYNVRYFLQECLYSVAQAIRNIDAEVYVVDNNSSDGSANMVKEQFPWVKLIANPHNPGFGAANNQAIALAEGEYILLQNPDTIVAEDTYARIIGFMDAKPDAGGLGVKMIDGAGEFLPESKRGLPTPEVAFYKIFGLSVLFPSSRVFGKYHLGYLDKSEIHAVDVLSGAFMLIRRTVLDKIGAFDEQFFMYGEDIDLSYRIMEAGYKNYYYPGTTIIHYKGESTKKGSLNYVFVFYKAMIIFARKHFATQKAALFSLLINSAVYIRAGIALVFRFLKFFTRPLADAVVLSSVLFLVSAWYESFKFGGDGHFPDSFYAINLPLYVTLWVVGLFFTNTYEKAYPKLITLFYGLLLGTVAISVTYAFLNESLRSSRALILLGAGVSLISLASMRWVLQIIRHRQLRWYNQSARRILFVGNASQWDRLRSLVKPNADQAVFLGFAGTSQEEELCQGFLGHYSRIQKILKLYRSEEIVYASEGISRKEVIALMEQQGERYTYKFFNEKGGFALGSNSKNAAGEIFTDSANYILNSPESRYNKRFTDVLVSLILLPLFPVLCWFVKRKAGMLSNIFKALAGQCSWVGFSKPDDLSLPRLRPGVVKTTYNPDVMIRGAADVAYAKRYATLRDVILLAQGIRHWGDTPA